MKRISALLITMAVLLPACTSTQWVQTTVAREYDFIVTLEQLPEKSDIAAQKYQHPYQINVADLEKVMGDVTYISKAGLMSTEKQNPVFQAVEIDRLAPALADALAKADASERIRFISFNQGKALMFSVPRKTEGVMFIASDGRLNFAFNSLNTNRQPSETTAFYATYAMVDPLTITTSDTPLTATAPYAELHKFATGKQAPLWVVTDLEKFRESMSTAKDPAVKVMEDVAPTLAPATVIMAAPVEESVQGQASAEVLKEDIKNKLKYLKELKDEGLITEKDYNSKKTQLLDKIN